MVLVEEVPRFAGFSSPGGLTTDPPALRSKKACDVRPRQTKRSANPSHNAHTPPREGHGEKEQMRACKATTRRSRTCLSPKGRIGACERQDGSAETSRDLLWAGVTCFASIRSRRGVVVNGFWHIDRWQRHVLVLHPLRCAHPVDSAVRQNT